MPAKDETFEDFTLSDILDEELDAEHKGKIRKVVLKDGNSIWIECVDPYGFWKVRLSKGRLPDAIKDNQYTTFRDALTAVNRWCREKRHAIVYQTNKDKVTEA